VRLGPRDAALRAARTCYDHLAGRLAVGVADAMADRGHIEFDDDAVSMPKSGRKTAPCRVTTPPSSSNP
jgi:hypothetical protein